MSIPIVKKERPESGMGSASPQYEMHTACCDILLAADDSLEKIRDLSPSHQKIDPAKLVIHDLGPKKSKFW